MVTCMYISISTIILKEKDVSYMIYLKEEYWVAEAKRMEECLITEESMKEVQKTEEVQDFDNLIELWTSVSLYIHVGYHLVSNVPDPQLKYV